MKRIAAIIVSLFFAGAAHGQSYGVMQWGVDKSVSPYGFGYNINGTWYNLGTVSSSGVWGLVVAGNYFGVPGATFDGVTDNTSVINTQINAIATAGGGTLYLPPGTAYLSGPILLKSNVAIIGASLGTTFSCAATCVGQTANSFVKGSRFNNINLTMRSGNTSDAILLSSVQDSDIGGIKISGTGFNSVLSIISAATTGGSDNTPGNTIFNNFHDIDAYAAPATYGVYVSGRYGASPPAPAQVVTINDFRNIKVRATNACYDFVKAADSNSLYNPSCVLAASGARAFVDADDATYASVNNYVNNQRYYSPLLTTAYNTGTFTYFSGNWTFGVEAYGLLSDVNPTGNTIIPVNYGTGSSYCIRGQNMRPEGIISGVGNLTLGEYCKNYYGKDNYIVNIPSEGFNVAATTTNPYNYLLFTPAANLTAGTVNLPCGSADGAIFSVGTTRLITRVTLTACTGDTVYIGANPLRLSANQTVKMKYVQSSGYWVTDAEPAAISGNWLNYIPTTGFSLASSSLTNYSYLLINPATDLASGTVQLPCNRDDSNEFTISTLKRITALTVTGCSSPANSVSIGSGKNPFWIDAGGTVTLTYLEASSTWVPKNTSSNLGNLAVAGGGTGLSAGTQWGLPYFSTATAMSSTGAGLTGQILISTTGAAPSWTTATFPATTTAGTILTSATANTVTASATPTLGVNATTTGTLGLANGGVGGATVTVQNNGATAAYNFNLPATAGTSGQPLLSGGGGATAMTFGTLGVAAGGTGLTAGTQWGIPYFSTTTAITSTGAGTTGQVLISTTGAAPSWGSVPINGTTLSTGATGVSINLGNANTWSALQTFNSGISATTVTATTAVISSANVPAASACGTGPTIAAGSSNNGGQFTIGSGATACTLTFATAYATTAFCTVSPTAAPAAIGNVPIVSASSRTAFTVSNGTASTAYNYTCFGN